MFYGFQDHHLLLPKSSIIPINKINQKYNLCPLSDFCISIFKIETNYFFKRKLNYVEVKS